jgi:arylsulfatase A-like enzyme
MMFMGNGAAARQFDNECETVDFAPTLAKMLGLTPPEEVDGKVLNISSLE